VDRDGIVTGRSSIGYSTILSLIDVQEEDTSWPIHQRNNPLAPWYIGFGLTLIGVVYVGYEFTRPECAITALLAFLI
jgi:hypothetical protein